MVEPRKSERANPLDTMMTKAQVARRKFKSGLPRTIQNRVLSKLEAMARTMEMFDKFRAEMDAAGLDVNDVSAALVFCQPETPGKEHVLAEVAALPAPEHIGKFVNRVMALDKPLFLGVLFVQQDREAEKLEKKAVGFAWPFMGGPDAQKRLIAARNQQAKGGLKKIAN